jgi:hypothetical protein
MRFVHNCEDRQKEKIWRRKKRKRERKDEEYKAGREGK